MSFLNDLPTPPIPPEWKDRAHDIASSLCLKDGDIADAAHLIETFAARCAMEAVGAMSMEMTTGELQALKARLRVAAGNA